MQTWRERSGRLRPIVAGFPAAGAVACGEAPSVLDPAGESAGAIAELGWPVLFVLTAVSVIVTGILLLALSALGALLALAPEPWFGVHAAAVATWGLTPLEDQQLAGLVMWIPAMAVYLATMAGLFLAWLGESEPGRRSDRGTSPAGR